MFASLEKISILTQIMTYRGQFFAHRSPRSSIRTPLYIPFIREHHPDSNPIFWLALADFHYFKQWVAWLNENIKFVSIQLNPPNIENFWHKSFTREAKTEQQLTHRVECKMKEFDTHLNVQIVFALLENISILTQIMTYRGQFFDHRSPRSSIRTSI